MIDLALLFVLAQAPAVPRVSFSGYVQPQYEVRTSGGETTDRVLFRRMFFTLDATVAANWKGQFQVDAGRLASFGERPIIKNAFIQYTGWRDHGYVVTIGNQKPPMSRSLLASSSRRGLIERPFTGDRAYGPPGRAPLIKIDGSHRQQRVSWSAAIGTSRQVPDADEVRIDGPSESGSAGNEGPLAGARLDIHPLGEPAREHGDFGGRGPRFTIGVAAYGWWNDNDVEPHGGDAVDASRVTAYEVSGALRGGGGSLDAQYNRVDARAVNEDVSAGLYLDGRALLHQASVEGGYMLWQRRLEAVAMFDAMDADSFSQTWWRAAAGMNWYVKRHDLKFSLMHRESFDEKGIAGARSHTTYVQTQFAF